MSEKMQKIGGWIIMPDGTQHWVEMTVPKDLIPSLDPTVFSMSSGDVQDLEKPTKKEADHVQR